MTNDSLTALSFNSAPVTHLLLCSSLLHHYSAVCVWTVTHLQMLWCYSSTLGLKLKLHCVFTYKKINYIISYWDDNEIIANK